MMGRYSLTICEDWDFFSEVANFPQIQKNKQISQENRCERPLFSGRDLCSQGVINHQARLGQTQPPPIQLKHA